jgi:pimeloyl-ACP methyl ester carboxylesterase
MVPIKRSKNGLAYTVSGKEGGPLLVFANGLGGLQESWFYQVRAFADSHQTLTFDHRGNGRSAYREGPARMETYVEDLIEILDEEGVDSADFVGISFGSRLLQVLTLHHPERVRSLTLCAGTAAPADPTGGSVLTGMGGMTVERFMKELVPLLFGPAYVQANRRRLEAFAKGRLRRPTDPRGLSMQWEAICHFDFREHLASIEKPVLILHGEEDRLTPIRAAEQLASGLPNATLVRLKDVGHSPQVEAIDRFNAALSDFLGVGA